MKLLSVLIGLATVVPAFAADPAADWLRMGRIDPGRKVQVRFHSGQVRVGTIQKVDADALTFIEGSGATLVKREDVREIRTRSRALGALWGAGIAAGIAAPIGGLAGSTIGEGRQAAAGAAVGWGGVGALIGVAVGKEHTIYKAGARKPESAATGGASETVTRQQ